MHSIENQPRAVRWMAMLAVTAGITLLASGCGGSPSADPGASSSASSPAEMALEYAQCIRSHGVPKYPDPSINGNSVGSSVSVNALGVSQSVLHAAQGACQKLSPQNFVPRGADSAQNIAQGRTYAECIRTHGVPDFPDPGSDGRFDVPASIDVQGAAYTAASNACQSVRPRSLFISQTGSS